jgi:hypothetical protein
MKFSNVIELENGQFLTDIIIIEKIWPRFDHRETLFATMTLLALRKN